MNPEADRRSARSDYLFLLFGLAVVFLDYHGLQADGQERFDALSLLLEEGKFSPVKYSLVGPLCAAPLYWLGKLVATPQWGCELFNRFVFTLGLVLMNYLLAPVVSGPVRRRFLMLLVFGSMFPYHLKHFYGEVFTAVTVAIGVLILCLRRSGWSWPWLVLGAANTPPALVGLTLVVLKKCLHSRRLRHVLVVLAAAGLIVMDAWVRRGSPFRSGYEGETGALTFLPFSPIEGFGNPFFFGVISILFSFGKGLVFFSPGLLLPIGKEDANIQPEGRSVYHYWLWFLAGLILIDAKWWAWAGGGFWGPRFFLFASIPASLALAVSMSRASAQTLARNLGTLVILTLSCWVGVNGMVFGHRPPEICVRDHYYFEPLCWYVPEFSDLWRPFVVRPDLKLVEIAPLLAFALGYLYLAAPLIQRCCKQGAEFWITYRNKKTQVDKWGL